MTIEIIKIEIFLMLYMFAQTVKKFFLAEFEKIEIYFWKLNEFRLKFPPRASKVNLRTVFTEIHV